MSCHGCATRFGLFSKENGCPACGFAYCSSCLKFKCEVPSLGKGLHKVCKKCYTKIMTKSEMNDDAVAPPDSFLKRLESLENPARPPITVYHTDKRTAKLKRGLSEKDMEIFNRLEKLRADRQPSVPGSAVTEEEIERRLALLRGQNPEIMTRKTCFAAPEKKSQQEQSDDLIKQVSDEIKLDSKILSPEDEIAERLRRLRSSDDDDDDDQGTSKQPTNVNTNAFPSKPSLDEIAEALSKTGSLNLKNEHFTADGSSSSNSNVYTSFGNAHNVQEITDSSDDEHEIKRIIAKAEDRARIEQEKEAMELDDRSSDQEELPWCCICNEDASRRCIDCDSDLYCDYCFKEGHKDLEMKTHTTVPYTRQK